MSKTTVAERRALTGYTTDLPTCKSCANFAYDHKMPKWVLDAQAKGRMKHASILTHGSISGRRCALHEFAVTPNGSCGSFVRKSDEAKRSEGGAA